MRNFLIGIVALSGIVACGVVYADESSMKIGTVDMQQALQSVDAGKKAKAELEKQLNAKKKELQTEEDSIKKAGEEFKKQSLVLSDEARSKKQSELQERIMKFQEETGRSQMELQKKEHDLTQPIINQLRTIISDMAKKKGYTMVLEKNDNTVLFSQDKDDMTTDVIGAYNKQFKGSEKLRTALAFSVTQILEWTGGTVANSAELKGGTERVAVSRMSTLTASQAEDVAFFFSRDYEKELPGARPGVLITGNEFVAPLRAAKLPFWDSSVVVACADPYFAMAVLSEKFAPSLSTVAHVPGVGANPGPARVHPTAVVDPTAELGAGADIRAHAVIEAGVRIGARTVVYPHCYVGPRASLGADCVLFPNVTVYEWTEIGDRVRIHAGTVIGADGFGYAPKRQGKDVVGHQKIYHLGRVVIGADCEIGANSCVDRATFGETWLGRQVKIDNQVQIGHNVRLDDGAVVCGGTGLAGNAKIGKFALLLGNVGVANQIVVGDGARVAAHTCVSKDVEPGSTVVGYPQRDFKEHFKIQALLNRLLAERAERRKAKGSGES